MGTQTIRVISIESHLMAVGITGRWLATFPDVLSCGANIKEGAYKPGTTGTLTSWRISRQLSVRTPKQKHIQRIYHHNFWLSKIVYQIVYPHIYSYTGSSIILFFTQVILIRQQHAKHLIMYRIKEFHNFNAHKLFTANKHNTSHLNLYHWIPYLLFIDTIRAFTEVF